MNVPKVPSRKPETYCATDWCALDRGHIGQCSDRRPDCRGCHDLPRHLGSSYCESGSIASGGTNAHCTCDTCF